jgi:uncharacterized protein with GYD domain
MAKYLWKARYTAEGGRGLMKEGAASRRAFIEQLITNVGGTLESFYWAFGDVDIYLIVDLPNDATATAVSMAVNTTGAVTVETVKLLTVEDIDQARSIEVGYRAPGA